MYSKVCVKWLTLKRNISLHDIAGHLLVGKKRTCDFIDWPLPQVWVSTLTVRRKTPRSLARTYLKEGPGRPAVMALSCLLLQVPRSLGQLPSVWGFPPKDQSLHPTLLKINLRCHKCSFIQLPVHSDLLTPRSTLGPWSNDRATWLKLPVKVIPPLSLVCSSYWVQLLRNA